MVDRWQLAKTIVAGVVGFAIVAFLASVFGWWGWLLKWGGIALGVWLGVVLVMFLLGCLAGVVVRLFRGGDEPSTTDPGGVIDLSAKAKKTPYRTAPGVAAWLEKNLLFPDETLLGTYPFFDHDNPSSKGLIVLTDANLRAAYFKTGVFEDQHHVSSLKPEMLVYGLKDVSSVTASNITHTEEKGGTKRHYDAIRFGFSNGNYVFCVPQGNNWRDFVAVAQKALHDRTQRDSGPSVAAELAALNELKEQGALTDEDWEQAKARFLGQPKSAADLAAEQLASLYQLHRTGVLSESEFNMKKWDILSKHQV